MRRPSPPLSRRVPLVLAACALALAALPGMAFAVPTAAPPEQSEPQQSEPQQSEPQQPDPEPSVPSLCPDDSLCAWPDPDFTGSVTEFPDPDGAGCRTLPRPARSAINDSSFTAVFYDTADCLGKVVIGVAPGRKASGFATSSSVRLRSATPRSATPPSAAAPAPAEPAESP